MVSVAVARSEGGFLTAQHGNTKSAKTDPTLKTRHFVDIVTEITRSMEIHREMGTILGGVHLELTGEVNEEGFSVVSLSDMSDAEMR
jgi:3-deoxy-D-arabino-heptulosonate 7-phosphate (DAHP) synthase class II